MDDGVRAEQPSKQCKMQQREVSRRGRGETDLLQRTCASSEACWSWQIPRHRVGAGPMPSSLKLPASGHTPAQEHEALFN